MKTLDLFLRGEVEVVNNNSASSVETVGTRVFDSCTSQSSSSWDQISQNIAQSIMADRAVISEPLQSFHKSKALK